MILRKTRFSFLPFYFFFLFSFFFPLLSFSQSSTLEINKDHERSVSEDLPETQYNRVMVIPFDPKMYMSQIDKEISEKTGKNADEIREIFRRGISNNVFIETKMIHNSAYSSVSMHSEDPEIISDLDYIYKSFGYKYVPVPVPPDTAKPTAVSSLKKATGKAQELFEGMNPPKEEPGAKIKNGQIYSTPENREKFMNTTVVNPDALAYLSSKYQCELFVFVNQMDLVVPPGTDYRELSSDDYSRLIKFHYTILNKSGSEIYGDAAKIYFSSRENDASAIVNGYFDEIAREIAFHLPDPSEAKAMQEKKKEEKKKANKQQSSFEDY